MSLDRPFKALSLPKLLHEIDVHIFSLRSRRQNRAWGEAQRNPRYDQDLSHKPAKRATAIGPISMMMKWRMTKSRRPLRGLDVCLCHIPGVPLTLHPRLYSDTRVRGLKYNIHDLCKNLGNDKV